MENFVYHLPVKVIFGRDTEVQVGAEASNYGKKILLHYGGGSIKRSGLYDRGYKLFAGGWIGNSGAGRGGTKSQVVTGTQRNRYL